MHEIKRIAFLGIGGVGGYYGGKLASCYAHSTEMEIIFIARNENEKAIREKGLLLRTASGEEYIHPKLISHDPVEIGTIDLLICSVKAYNLEESLQQIQSCISPDTIILPLLNGVNNRTRIHALLPWVNCWQGCAYIVSRLIQPGIVHETGQWNQLLFGDENVSGEIIQKVESIFTKAGINAKGIQQITPVLWTKFIFLSPIATMTTLLNAPIGAVLNEEQQKNNLFRLIQEIASIANAQGIGLPVTIVADTLNKIESLPFETYSSMHFDHYRGKKTEIDSLTGQVCKLGKSMGIPTPAHDEALALLKGSS